MQARPKHTESADEIARSARWTLLRPIERVILLAALGNEARGGQMRMGSCFRPQNLELYGYVTTAKRGDTLFISLTDEGRKLAQVHSGAPLAAGDRVLRTQRVDGWLCPVCGFDQIPPAVAVATLTGVPCLNCGCTFRLTSRPTWTAEFLSVELNPREVSL